MNARNVIGSDLLFYAPLPVSDFDLSRDHKEQDDASSVASWKRLEAEGVLRSGQSKEP